MARFFPGGAAPESFTLSATGGAGRVLVFIPKVDGISEAESEVKTETDQPTKLPTSCQVSGAIAATLCHQTLAAFNRKWSDHVELQWFVQHMKPPANTLSPIKPHICLSGDITITNGKVVWLTLSK